MKRNLFFYVTLLVGTMFILQSFTGSKVEKSTAEDIVFPEDVKMIIDNKCFGCHNSDSKNEKGKEKLQLDKLSDLEKKKLVAAIGEIHEVVTEDEMPPEKFLEKYPEKKLTADEKKVLTDWADKVSDELMN